MRFGKMAVDGFGIHREQTFELDGQAPLVLFAGRNETGKSTIMGFIRTMLFGFPTRARMPERYEPVGGGNHGGMLTLLDDAGREIRLERYDKPGYPKLHFPDGRVAGEAELKSLLGGLTPDLYRNLFAFSLSELNRLETLQGDEISGFLYGSGMGVSGSAVVQAEKQLAGMMDELYKPRGIRQAINLKLKQLDDIDGKIRLSREQSGEFNERRSELEQLDREIARMEEEVRSLRARAEWLNKCARAREPWQEIREIDRELAEAPERYTLPPEAEALLADKPELDRWRQKTRELPKIRVEMAELSRQLDSERANLEADLRNISPEWTVEHAKRFPFAIIRQKEIEDFRQRFDRLHADIHAARERLSSQDGEGGQLSLQLETDQSRVEELENAVRERLPADATEDPDGFAAALRQAWSRVKSDAGDFSRASRKREDALRSLQSLRRDKPASSGRAFRWAAMALAAVAALFVAAVIRWSGGEPAAAYGTGAVLFLAGATVALLATRKPKEDPFADMRKTWETIAAEAEREEAEAARRTAESRDKLLRLLSGIPQAAEAAAAAGAVPDDPAQSVRELESLMDALEREMAGWRKRMFELEQARADRERSHRALEAWKIRRRREADLLERLERDLSDCRREWEEWLGEYGLPADLLPESLNMMGQYARQALNTDGRISNLAARLDALRQEEHQCRIGALALLERHRECLVKHGGIAFGLPAINADGQADSIETKDDWEERLNRLCAVAEHFAAVRQRRERKEEERRQQKRLLEGWMPEDRLDEMEDILVQYDADQLAAQLAEAKARTDEAQAELNRLNRERGSKESELNQLLQGEQHAELLLDGKAKEAELEQLAGQYAVRAMASLLIRRAREIHERERQPGVLRRAARYFSLITQGRYVNLYSPMGEKEIHVETARGERLSSQLLSRGTAEQLYLAMRFALAEEYERIVSLPLVMDDIFVNFDRTRLEQTLNVLAEVSGRRQVLLFTCHEHVAEAVTRAIPKLQRIDLSYSS